MSLEYRLRQSGAEVQAAIDKIIALEPGALDAIGILSHDAAYWVEHASDIPAQGALLIYNGVEGGQFKVGDGVTSIADLPFVGAELAQAVTEHIADAVRHITAQERQNWNNKSDFSGRYQDLVGKPFIPTRLSDLTEDSEHRTVTDQEKADWNTSEVFRATIGGTTYQQINEAYIAGKKIFAYGTDRHVYEMTSGWPRYGYDFAAVVGSTVYYASVDFLNEWMTGSIDLSSFITSSVDNLVNYYLKSETYTKDEVQQLISSISQFEYVVVSALPTASAATMHKIYLIPSSEPQSQNIKDEFITVETSGAYSWEQIGSTAIDLSNYVTTSVLNAAIAQVEQQLPLVAVSGLTTFDEIVEARAAGRIVVCKSGRSTGGYDVLTELSSDKAVFMGLYGEVGEYGDVEGGLLVEIITCALDEGEVMWGFSAERIRDFFAAQYGHTQYSDIYAQWRERRPVCVQYDSHYYVLSSIDTNGTMYFTAVYGNTVQTITLTSQGQWSNSSVAIYSKPLGGIPKTDLAPDVQGTLDEVSRLGQKVTPPIYQDADSVYKDCIKELYYFGKLPTNISCMDYGNYIRFVGSDNSVLFICQNNLSSWQDDVIYPLIVTATNDTIHFPVGAVVGYIIFKDITTFKAHQDNRDIYYLNQDAIINPTANSSILGMLTKTHKPVYQNTADIYNSCIEEIYFSSKLPSAGISFRCYSNSVAIFRGFNPNNAFTCSLNPSSCTNGVTYPLVITATNDSTNYPLNVTVGYIRFKDIATFKANHYNADDRWLNLDIITNILNSPIILSALPAPDGTINTAALADYAVTEIKIADKFIKVSSSFPDYDIRGMIAELYFKKDSVVFNDTGGYTNVVLKTNGGALYIRPYNGTTSYGWQSATSMSNYVNGVVYPIVVTANGVNSAYSIGDVVGYIVFKDIDALKNTSNGGNPGTVIRDNAIQLCYSPMIYSYINSQNIQIVGVVKFPEIQIPKDIYIVQGNQLMIFYKSIVKAYDNIPYGLRVVCSVGKAYPKYYLLQADTLGDYTATFYVVDNDDNIISQKATTIHCVSAMSAPSANKNVLVFGASATASGYIAGELKRRLTDNTGDGTPQNPTGLALSNIAFVGRKVGTMVNVNQEATGGWSWLDYSGTGRPAYRFNVSGVTQLNIGDTYTQNDVLLTITEINITGGSGNIRCIYEGTNTLSPAGTLTRSTGTGDATITYTSFDSESYNPFWNPNKAGGAGLDFQNYATLYCNGSIDVMISHCGLNDISRYTPATIQDLFTDYVKPFIRAYHTDFPNGKFIISTLPLPSPTGGMGANYGASAYWNWLTTSLKLWAFSVEAEKLVEDAEFSSYVYLADDVPVFDCEHSYPYAMAYVNNRSTEQEELGTNGVHPTSVGSYQVADAIYMTFNRMGLS